MFYATFFIINKSSKQSIRLVIVPARNKTSRKDTLAKLLSRQCVGIKQALWPPRIPIWKLWQQLRCRMFLLHLWLNFPWPSAFSSPEAADSSSFDVQLGDIILTATDGLFDNMPDYMILQELKKLKVSLLKSYSSFHTQLLVVGQHPYLVLFLKWLFFLSFQTSNYDSILQTAQSIAKQAHDLAYDPNYMSPFAQFACDNGLNVRGKYSGL